MENKIIHPEGWKATKGYSNGILSPERIPNPAA